jgi:hypothetical protein
MPEDEPARSWGLAARGSRSNRSGGARAAHMSFTASLVSVARDPVVTILLLAGIFDGLSGNPVHAILLFAVAAALARDAIRSRRLEDAGEPTGSPAAGASRRPSPGAFVDLAAAPRAAMVILAVAFALIVGSFGRYSWPATAAVLFPAAGGLAIAWRGPRHADRGETRGLDPAGALAWVAVFVTLALWELTNLLLQPSLTTDSAAHPTISVMTDPILASHPGRSLAVLGWLLFGWFLIER